MKKGEIYPEKGKNLASKIPARIADSFRKQARNRRNPIKYCLAAAVKLWIELPDTVQARLLNQSLDADSFIALVQEIVDERIEAGRKAARKSLEPPHKKRNRKG